LADHDDNQHFDEMIMKKEIIHIFYHLGIITKHLWILFSVLWNACRLMSWLYFGKISWLAILMEDQKHPTIEFKLTI